MGKGEVKQIEAELLNMDRQMEMLERDHRVHIKVHEQKVQNLEYDHKNSRRQVQEEGLGGIKRERAMHADRVIQFNKEKVDIKRDVRCCGKASRKALANCARHSSRTTGTSRRSTRSRSNSLRSTWSFAGRSRSTR